MPQFSIRGRPRRILYRIILPFILLFAAIAVLSWLFSAYLMTHFLDHSIKKQMERVANVISHSSYVLNPGILRQLRDVVDAEIVVTDRDGLAISSTLPDFQDLAMPVDLLAQLQPEQPVMTDDEHMIRYAFEEFLKDEGHTPVLAQDADAALAAIEAHRPEIVFLDYRLPAKDGLVLLGEIRKSAPDVAVVFMTAFGAMDVAIKAMQRGAYE